MFRIKICGITEPKDACAAAAAGADAIGLNFYDQSPRHIDQRQAEAIVAVLPPAVAKVGLFVNAEPDLVAESAERFGLDYVQLHGDEPPESLEGLESPIIKVFRLGPTGLNPAIWYVERCRELGIALAAVLVDSLVVGAYGGTGQTTNWRCLAGYPRQALPPLVLAGGLTPDNVAEAVRVVDPAAIDTASGVEISPGHKSVDRMTAFVRNARLGWGGR